MNSLNYISKEEGTRWRRKEWEQTTLGENKGEEDQATGN